MRIYTPDNLAQQVDKIRAEIRSHGNCVVGCEEFGLLCSEIVSDKEKIKGVEQIAQWEGWICENLPDDKMRFSSLRLN